MTESPCPDEARLRLFARGDLREAELDRIVRHVADCHTCATWLDTHDDGADDLEQQLRSMGSTHIDPDVPRDLLLAARSVYGESEDGRPSLVVDSGGRIAQALQSGPVQLDRFELIEQVGTGAFGSVFRARDTTLDRIVAVKVQRAPDDEEERVRFSREARSAAQLEHPNIASLYETGCTPDGALYLVTEFVAGRTLERVLDGHRPSTPREAAALVSQVARSLQYAHEQGVVHRDVKPSNIIIDEAGAPHLMDFGLAKRETVDDTVTLDGAIMGTPAYMSPEQARGASHEVDARTDIFSLGVILYELLTGDRPFHGNRRMLMLQLLEDEPLPPRRLVESIPRALETICLTAMAKSPARRYASAGEFADDLDRFGRAEPIRARPPTPVQRLTHWCRRNPMAASLFLAVTIGSTSGLGYLSFLSHEFVEDTALRSAGMQSEMLEEMNSLYSEIVANLPAEHVNVTHEYRDLDHAVPLPATFTIEAGERISRLKTGMQVRLYSDFPFPWRIDGGPQDAFEREALAILRANPREAHHEFTKIGGHPQLRYATARVMQPSCIGCHNTHADSPKRDWAVGDVRGVLEIIRPLDQDQAQVRAGLGGSFILVGVVSVALLGVAIAILFGGRRRIA